MNRLVIAAVLVGCCLGMPQQRQASPPANNPFVKILELESYQNGANYGHALQQEDGTASGQKVGPDGLVYGFYSYISDNGQRIKVYYRAGQGVGYEVLKVEGIDGKGLINVAKPAPAPKAPQVQQPIQSVHQTISQALPQQPKPVVRQPVVRQPAPVIHQQPTPVIQRQPEPVVQRAPLPVLPQINPLIPQEPTPAPHRFDYAANLNLQRTGTGFRSSFKAL